MRRRVASGAALLVGRGLAVRGLGFVGNIVLAALLTPLVFGTVAIGAAMIVSITLVSDGGLGAALIRGDHEPSRLVFEQLNGLQLTISGVVTLAALAAAPFLGRPGWVAAVMTSSLCIAVFGSASNIYLERHLMFRQLATIDVAESLAYLLWTIPAALLGAGVWALATASVAQVTVRTVLVLRLAPVRVLRPRFGLTAIRPLLAFGARFQAINAVNLVRDQGLNIGVAAVAGISTLGVWTMAFRFIQIPFLLFESLWRVTFPGMARLIEAGEDPRPAVRRILTQSSILTGAIMAALVGATPGLIPAVLNHRWHSIVDILPWACAGLLVGGPVSVAVAGFLFAKGDASTVLRGAVLHTGASLVLGLALLPVIGVRALGMSVLASAVVEGTVLGARAEHTYDIRIVRPLVIPTLASAVAATMGWIAASHITPSAVGAAAGGGIAVGTFVVAFRVLDPRALRDTLSLVTRTVRSASG